MCVCLCVSLCMCVCMYTHLQARNVASFEIGILYICVRKTVCACVYTCLWHSHVCKPVYAVTTFNTRTFSIPRRLPAASPPFSLSHSHTCTSTHTHTHTHTRTHIPTYTYTYSHIHTHAHTRVHRRATFFSLPTRRGMPGSVLLRFQNKRSISICISAKKPYIYMYFPTVQPKSLKRALHSPTQHGTLSSV